MSPLDLSFRHKLPLWGAVLILITALAITATLMVQSYAELEEDLAIDAGTLAHALAPNLFSPMRQDNVWRTYETISGPLLQKAAASSKAENILAIGNDLRIYVAAHPMAARMQTPLSELGPEFAVLANHIRSAAADEHVLIKPPGSARLFFATPIADEGTRIGTLVIVLTKGSFMPRFYSIALDGLVASAVLLSILLPANWYWGNRMARPLAQLTERMRDMGGGLPETLDADLYAHKDELGSLFKTYNKMLADLRAKEELERQVVQSDRLAALGQLAAGVAHEINNPLGGMLMAIDTLKSHSVTDARTAKTIALLERGLGQIRDTVGALLVEARLKSRRLTAQDIEDVLLLVLPQARNKALHLEWRNDLLGEVALPATLVRQVLINLLLNAVHAANQAGTVDCRVRIDDGRLFIEVANDGKILTAEQMSHLFEPFSPLSDDGHGLGLWVSYQIVHQLGGDIRASRNQGRMRFDVKLPIGDEPA